MGGRDVNLKTKSTLLNEDGYRPEEKKHFFVAYRYNPAYPAKVELENHRSEPNLATLL